MAFTGVYEWINSDNMNRFLVVDMRIIVARVSQVN